MKAKRSTRMRTGGLLTALFLIAVLTVSSAFAEEAAELKPYSSESGYTYVYFGRYLQSIDGGNPDEGTITLSWRKMYTDWEKETRKALGLKKKDPLDPYDPGPLEPQPILWRVLSVDGKRVYLMSEYILFAAPVHSSMAEYRETGSDFGQTELCRKLNGEFADAAFTEEEKAVLLSFGKYGKVSLPSGNDLNDAAMGFTKRKLATRKAKATEYAIRVTGAIVYRAAVGNSTPYWLREQSATDKRHARSTKQDGSLGRLHCDATDVGARPVIRLKTGGYEIVSGSGTKDDPYLLSPKGQ